ncbi:MAG: hypothetical protein QW300_03825, partial [Desulfurococcaceae archaeon]
FGATPDTPHLGLFSRRAHTSSMGLSPPSSSLHTPIYTVALMNASATFIKHYKPVETEVA